MTPALLSVRSSAAQKQRVSSCWGRVSKAVDAEWEDLLQSLWLLLLLELKTAELQKLHHQQQRRGAGGSRCHCRRGSVPSEPSALIQGSLFQHRMCLMVVCVATYISSSSLRAVWPRYFIPMLKKKKKAWSTEDKSPWPSVSQKDRWIEPVCVWMSARNPPV